MRSSTIILISLFVSCGECSKSYIDPALAPYVSEFKDDMRSYYKDTKRPGRALQVVKFSNLAPGLAGTCKVMEAESINVYYMEIHISNKLRDGADDFLRRTMYHELGHCLLDLDHVEGKPSLMNSTINDSYGASIPELIEQLFTEEY